MQLPSPSPQPVVKITWPVQLLIFSSLSGKSIPSIDDAQKALVKYLKNLTQELNIPTLSEFELTDSDVQSIVEKAKKSSSMRYNPIKLTEDVLIEILQQVT